MSYKALKVAASQAVGCLRDCASQLEREATAYFDEHDGKEEPQPHALTLMRLAGHARNAAEALEQADA